MNTDQPWSEGEEELDSPYTIGPGEDELETENPAIDDGELDLQTGKDLRFPSTLYNILEAAREYVMFKDCQLVTNLWGTDLLQSRRIQETPHLLDCHLHQVLTLMIQQSLRSPHHTLDQDSHLPTLL